MSHTPSTRELVVAIALAAVVLAVGVGVVVRPDLLEVLPSLEPRLAMIGSGLLLLLAAVAVGIAGKLRGSAVEPLGSSAVDTFEATDSRAKAQFRPRDELHLGGESSGRPVVGQSYDRYVDLATAYGEESREIRDDARETLLESLRPVAARTYASVTGCSRTEAIRAVETGQWTDDARAAAFLATEDGPSTPVWLWVFDLVRTADPFVRGLERTIDELERLHARRITDGISPKRRNTRD